MSCIENVLISTEQLTKIPLWDHVTRSYCLYGPLTRYAKLRVAHEAGRERFSPTAGKRSQRASRHLLDARAVIHSGIADRRFLWSRRRGKRSRHYQSMRKPQFCVSGKRPIQQNCMFWPTVLENGGYNSCYTRMKYLSASGKSLNKTRYCHSIWLWD